MDDIKIDGQPLFKQNLTSEELEYKKRASGDVGIRRPDVLLFPSEGKCIIIEFKAPGVDVSKHLHQIVSILFSATTILSAVFQPIK